MTATDGPEKYPDRAGGHTPRARLVAASTISERRMDVAGVPTALMEGGSGPPVVFLQGEFGPVWVRVIPELVRTHRVIAPDLPGLGASALPSGRLDANTVLAWLDQLVRHTCSSPPVVVGKAVGGAIAARFAARQPGRLDRLVLVDSFGLARFRPPPAMALTYLSVLLRPTERGVERSFSNYCFADLDRVRAEMGATYQWIADYALECFRTPRVRTALRALARAFGSAIPRAELARITTPTTLIWGRHDVGVPLTVAEAASQRYGWPLHVIDQARDDPALEQPDAFLAAVRAAMAGSSEAIPAPPRRQG